MGGALIALLLPWFVGATWTYWLTTRSPRWNWAIVAGHGYILGLFLTTACIRAWDLAGLPLNFYGICSVVALIGLGGMLLIRLRPGGAQARTATGYLPAWHKVAIAGLLALIAMRYTTIIQEVMLRPLFPWDAWMNWAPKAIVWFEYKSLVPFAGQESWLSAPAEARIHIEGAKNAWKYPVAVPLVQLWGMLAIDSSDSTAIYLPWALIALALGAALYGHLKLLGHSTLVSLLAGYLLLSIPFVNVHSALAGYADLWVMVVFGSSVLAFREWERARGLGYAVLGLAMAVFCTQLKIPGIIMGGIAILLFFSTLLPPGKKLLWLGAAAAAAVLYVFTIGLRFTLPGAGSFVLGPDDIVLPYIGEFPIRYHDVSAAMMETVFLMINWHLLWYVFCIAILLLVVQDKLKVLHNFEFRASLLTLGFIVFVYYFTERYLFALDYTQVNRAILYAVPVAILLLASLISRDDQLYPVDDDAAAGPKP